MNHSGLIETCRYVLGPAFVCQLVLLYRFEAIADLGIGLKPLVLAA